MRARILGIVVLLACGLSGCVGWSFWDTPPEKVAKAERKVADSDRKVIAEGQGELAGGVAAVETLPESEAKRVGLDMLNRAADLVAQGNGPLDSARAKAARDIALGLLSSEVAKRGAAERALAVMRGKADDLAADNARLKGRLVELQGELAASWRAEHDTANKYRWWRNLGYWLLGGVGLMLLLPALASVASVACPAVAPLLGIASRAVGYVVAPALQFARDKAIDSIARTGKAIEELRQDLPEKAGKITRTVDSWVNDTDHQGVMGRAAEKYRLKERPLEPRVSA